MVLLGGSQGEWLIGGLNDWVLALEICLLIS